MRKRTSIGLALLMVLSATSLSAEAPSAERYTFARPPAPESTVDSQRLGVTLDRYSTDTEREQLLTVMSEKGQEAALDGLRHVSRIGTLTWPGGVEYAVRYARQRTLPDGGSQIVMLVDRPLWLWWQPNPPSTPYSFSVVQLQLGPDGRGEGRVSAGVPVMADKVLGIVLADYDKAPALLADVRRERTS
jgi:hypothetical protein